MRIKFIFACELSHDGILSVNQAAGTALRVLLS